jgi:prophage antirepressor-like protein
MDMVPSASTSLVFTFPETAQPVRSVMIDGEPWFHHGDVCKILQHTNPTVAARMLDDDESGLLDLREISAGQTALSEFRAPATGNSEARFVTEAGLYTLVFGSKAPGAPTFRRWITHEVIPSIRRTGSYSATPAAVMPDLTSPAGVLALAEQFVVTARQLVEADRRVAELEPKALAHDTLMAAQSGDMLVRQAAKILDWKERDLRALLLDEKLIYRRQRTCGDWEYDFYAAFGEQFNAVKTVVEHTWGSCAHYTLHLTPRGLSFVQMRIEKRRAAMHAAILGGAA